MSLMLLSVAAMAAAPTSFHPPFAANAGGKAIQLEIGHAAPLMKDMNGDGKPDLVVGQFMRGEARVFLNVGEASAPKFGAFAVLQGGGKPATVSYG